jgi:hypothetical protein
VQPLEIRQDGGMGSDGSKSRKDHHPLPKVPKYEEPNDNVAFSGHGGEGFGREGHATAAKHGQPGRFGTLVLRMLGKKPPA